MAISTNITPEIWISRIENQLFQDNNAFAFSVNDSAFIENGALHLPQAGSLPAMVRDRSIFPATISSRTDTMLSYVLHSYTSDPISLRNAEALQLSYGKMDSILVGMRGQLTDGVYNWVAYEWANTVATSQVRTTGTTRLASHPTQTGNRKAIAYTDVLRAASILNVQNIPMEGRKMLVDAYLYEDIQNLIKTDLSGGSLPILNGVVVNGFIGRLCGFDVYMRSTVAKYNNAATPVKQDPSVAYAATTNLGAICWHPDFVRKATGDSGNGGFTFRYSNEDPIYYGTVMSAEILSGASKSRSDEYGVVTIIETAA